MINIFQRLLKIFLFSSHLSAEEIILENKELDPLAKDFLETLKAPIITDKNQTEIILTPSPSHTQTQTNTQYIFDFHQFKTVFNTLFKNLENKDRNFEPFILYHTLINLLNLYEANLNQINLKNKNFKKLIRTIQNNINQLLSEQKEIEHCFKSFLTLLPSKTDAIFKSIALLKILNSKKELIITLFGIKIENIIDHHYVTFIHLARTLAFVTSNHCHDLPNIYTFAESFSEIEFSYFEYNADIACFYYQRMNFSLGMAKDILKDNNICCILQEFYIKFINRLEEYCHQNLFLPHIEENKAILLLLYITAINPTYYQLCSGENQQSLSSTSDYLAKNFSHTFYCYFSFYISALELLTYFEQYTQTQKFDKAQIILHKFENIKLAEDNIDNASPYDMLAKGSLNFLIFSFCKKLKISNNLTPALQVEKIFNTISPSPPNFTSSSLSLTLFNNNNQKKAGSTLNTNTSSYNPTL